MGYALHINRINNNGEAYNDDGELFNPISIDEWKQAIPPKLKVCALEN